MKTQVEIFSSSNADAIMRDINKFLAKIYQQGIPVVDIKFSTTEKTFDAMVIYKGEIHE